MIKSIQLGRKVVGQYHPLKYFTWHGALAANTLQRFFSSNERISGLQVNPDSVGYSILPGGEYCMKRDPRTGENRKVLVERNFGSFWHMKDLKKTNNKPTLSNKNLIPETEASVFPTLENCLVLENDENITIPDFFLSDNRANDPSAQCTLVAISYKDYGAKLLESWTEPFEEYFGIGQRRARVMRLFITEGYFTKALLSGVLKQTIRSNTPQELHSQTLLRFGSDGLLEFNDTLRMHNTLTGYVFLLDGLGRVRICGSGGASEDEASQLIQFARQLTPKLRQKGKSPPIL
mmetsp:Transcript_19423/g.28785  ORF Transcript_19423/g.28785 Transcript_19423/m.28785 type:complete len:291 (-) Transcript_19423:2208-3080(-)